MFQVVDTASKKLALVQPYFQTGVNNGLQKTVQVVQVFVEGLWVQQQVIKVHQQELGKESDIVDRMRRRKVAGADDRPIGNLVYSNSPIGVTKAVLC